MCPGLLYTTPGTGSTSSSQCTQLTIPASIAPTPVCPVPYPATPNYCSYTIINGNDTCGYGYGCGAPTWSCLNTYYPTLNGSGKNRTCTENASAIRTAGSSIPYTLNCTSPVSSAYYDCYAGTISCPTYPYTYLLSSPGVQYTPKSADSYFGKAGIAFDKTLTNIPQVTAYCALRPNAGKNNCDTGYAWNGTVCVV